jgi:hypothetical protein
MSVYLQVMVDEDIRNIIEAVIENDMAAPKVPKKRVPKLKRIWKCHQVPERYRRQLSKEEDNEVFEIIQPHIEVLRRYFAYYKDTHRRTKN